MAEERAFEARARNPASLAGGPPNLTVLRADLMDPTAIGPAIAGQDAIVTAMRERGTRRLVVVSNSGMHVDEADGPVTRFAVKPILGRVLKHSFADMRRMEDLVRASGLDWTIVRPPMLTDGPRTGTYRAEIDRNVRGGNRVSRADLADQLLRCLADERTVRAAVAVAN
ncbi:putative NADH-flavin reductase [Saccharothrix ecbatanensis]|uniref:Putative NADH-flavin reductase n=1 Tax=Saccharothrix ecbatanensis TaxID=1105145 RepID=A0A7W9HEX6_9PSEU|nr:NAD(P)-binding oxidoreductase [Saccharothrix ecbatanensis]MBB5801032.1 putative NADH-flavin reductase [Saccharothrix ecbatanensis]